MPRKHDPQQAVSTGDYRAIRELLANRSVSIEPDETGRTLLHDACAYVFPVIVSDLIASGMFDLNLADQRGFTPLHFATGIAAVEKFGFMRRISDIPESRQTRRLTVIEKKAMLCVRLLYTNGARVDPADRSGMRPIDYASQIGFEKVVTLLEASSDSFPTLGEYFEPKLFVRIYAEGEIQLSYDFSNLAEQVVHLNDLRNELEFVNDQYGYLSFSLPTGTDDEISPQAREGKSAVIQALRAGILPLGSIDFDPLRIKPRKQDV